MWNLLLKGGPVMYFIFLASLVGFYIVIYKLIFFRIKLQDKRVLEDIKEQLRSYGRDSVYHQLRSKRGFYQEFLSNVLARYDGIASPEVLARSSVDVVAPKVQSYMSTLASITTILPIMGLLGTVLGLMDIFNIISGGSIDKPEVLASGIALALITTAGGLAGTVPLLIFYNYLNSKIEVILSDLEHVALSVASLCKGK